MSIASGLVVYFMIWWTVIFMVLPWGVHRNRDPDLGQDPGAPKRSFIIRKLIITTFIATLLWIAVYLFIEFNDLEIF